MAITDVNGTRTPPFGTFTVTLASPGVFTYNSHGLNAGDMVVFRTTGALPTGLTAGTVYYVISAGLSTNSFEVSATDGGAAVNTSVSQSGTHTMIPEVVLADSSAASTYQLLVDKNAMQAGDAIEIRYYHMVLTGGTRRVAYQQPYYDAQPADDLIAEGTLISTPLADSGAVRATLKQFAGVARAFPWSFVKFQ